VEELGNHITNIPSKPSTTGLDSSTLNLKFKGKGKNNSDMTNAAMQSDLTKHASQRANKVPRLKSLNNKSWFPRKPKAYKAPKESIMEQISTKEIRKGKRWYSLEEGSTKSNRGAAPIFTKGNKRDSG